MTVANATKTVVGVFDSLQGAETAVRELEGAGFSRDHISIIANKNVSGESATTGTESGTSEATSHVATDAGIGAALGGVGGLLLSFAALAVPGVGPVLALGPIVAALSGAGIGAVAGGMVGALTQSGVPEEEAAYYAEGVRRGNVLVSVQAVDADAERARDILDQHGAVDVEGRASGWRERGWSGHNAGAEPLSQDELRREREYYSAANVQAAEWTREEGPGEPVVSSLPETRWPHEQAHPIGESYVEARTRTADLGTSAATPNPVRVERSAPLVETRTAESTGSLLSDSATPVKADFTSTSNFGDSMDNNRRPDPASLRAESGFDRSMDSAVRSAKRMASRIYDTKKP